MSRISNQIHVFSILVEMFFDLDSKTYSDKSIDPTFVIDYAAPPILYSKKLVLFEGTKENNLSHYHSIFAVFKSDILGCGRFKDFKLSIDNFLSIVDDYESMDESMFILSHGRNLLSSLEISQEEMIRLDDFFDLILNDVGLKNLLK